MKFFLSRNHKRNIKTLCRRNFKRYSFQNLTSKGFCKHEKSTFHFRSIEMDSSNSKNAGSSLEALMTSFNARILELQELVIARNSEFFNQPFTFRFLLYILYTEFNILWICIFVLQCTQRAVFQIFLLLMLLWVLWSFRCKPLRRISAMRWKLFLKQRYSPCFCWFKSGWWN